MNPNGTMKYGAVSQAFHWITVVLVIVLLLTGLVGDVEADEPGNTTFMWHGSLGVVVLALAAARILSRLFRTAPPLPPGMTKAERMLARAVHIALYALLLALPISGWLVASAEGASVNFFDVTSLPRWQGGADAVHTQTESPPQAAEHEESNESASASAEQREHFWEEVHEVLGYAILVIASLHALAALKHHFINRDDVLRSMLPGRRDHTRMRADQSGPRL